MRRLLAVALAALPLVALAGPGDIPTDEAGFTEYMARRIRQEVGDTPVTIKEPLTLTVGSFEVYVGRIHRFCGSGAAGCAGEVDHFVGGVASMLKESKERPHVDRAAVRMVLRDAERVKVAQQTSGAGAPPIQFRPFAGSIVELVVVDTPTTVRYVDDRALHELKMTRAELFALARANVAAGLRPLSEKATPVQHGQLGSITGSEYEVSRVALHEQWTNLARAQGGTLLIALPATDVVLYASERSPLAVDALRTIAREVMGKVANPLSAEVFEWTPDGWVLVP